MGKVYLKTACAISSQKTYDNSVFLEDVVTSEEPVVYAKGPNYKEYIPPAAARRMATGIKMSIVASKIALQEAQLDNVDAVITGTGMGCLKDSEKFVSGILDNGEQFLTPTAFIQSTHNTVAGQIALDLQCKGYNFTYVHGALSFESALYDAHLMLAANEVKNVLVGGVDELAKHTTHLHTLIDHIKPKGVRPKDVLATQSKGAIFSEGASFFVLSNEKIESTCTEIIGLTMYKELSQEDLPGALDTFLKEHNLHKEEIDTIVLGMNGDVDYDGFYDYFIKDAFAKAQQLIYKHLVGEYMTVSAFGMWVVNKMFSFGKTPDLLRLNKIEKEPKMVLLYNQYRGEYHSFVVLKRC